MNKVEAKGGDGITQFTRALSEINVDLICANSPQAKGLIERSFGTLQDRLVKELRLVGISTSDTVNAFLPGFLDAHNERFAKPPVSETDAHRPVPANVTLTDVFAWKEERTVTNNLTVQYDQTMFLLEPSPATRTLARKRVTVIDYPDGRIVVRHAGVDLPYRSFDRRQKVDQAAIVDNKRLGEVLAYIAEKQQDLEMTRSRKAPRRQGQTSRGLSRMG